MLRASEFPQPRRRPRPRLHPGPWLLVFTVALGVRAAVMIGSPPLLPGPAAPPIDAITSSLVAGGGFAIDHRPTAASPPVVPWLTSLVRSALGGSPLAGRLVSCTVGALIPLLIGTLGSMTFGTGAGRLAAWFAAASPLLSGFTSLAGLETTTTLLVLVALVLTAAWIRTPQPGRALGVGLAWGAAALTHPNVLTLVLVIACWTWVPLGLTVLPRERTRQLVLAVLGLAIVVGPWMLRNAIVLHAVVPVSTGGGMTLLAANQPRVWDDERLRGGAVDPSLLDDARSLRTLPEPERDRRAGRRALGFVGENLDRWPAVAIARVRHLWQLGDGGDSGDPERSPGPLFPELPRVLDLLLIESVVMLPLAAWGTMRTLMGERRWYQSLALLPVLHLTLAAVLVYGAQRSRVPITPLVGLFAAVGFEDLRRRARSRARGLRVIRGRGFASR